MYNISESVKSEVYTALISADREFRQRISFGEWRISDSVRSFAPSTMSDGAEMIQERGIIKLDISQKGNSDGSGLVMGCCCSSSCTVEFYNLDKTFNYYGKIMFVECGIKISDEEFYYIPCGYFKIDEPETDDDGRTLKITAYDDIDRMSYKWSSSLSFPATAEAVIRETAGKYGITVEYGSGVQAALASRNITASEAKILTAYTEREVLGFIAGLAGANARMNTVGNLKIDWYTEQNEITVPANLQWQNGFKKTSEAAFEINSITSGIDDAVFTAGTGTGISFANPIITEDEITAIFEKYDGRSFQPCTCEWRGNPCIECGDIFTAVDRNGVEYTVYVANQDIDFTGGLSVTVESPGGDAEVSFDTVDERTRAALNRQKTELQEAILAATDVITQTKGSIFELVPVDDTDPTKGNSGFVIKSEYTENMIVGNIGGIGFSTDGGETMDALALYFKQDETGKYRGHINAELIEAGAISAEQIKAGSIGAEQIAANSITADKLLIGDSGNLSVVNPDNSNPYGATVITDETDGLKYFCFGSTSAGYWALDLNKNFSPKTTFQIGEKLLFRATIKTTGNAKLMFRLRAYYTETDPDTNSNRIGMEKDPAANAVELPTEWQTVNIPLEVAALPNGKYGLSYYRLFVETVSSSSYTGLIYARDISVYRMTNSVLIADGAITADKIAVHSITTDHIDTDNLVIGTGNVSGLDKKLSTISDAADGAETAAKDVSDTLSELTVLENDITVVKGARIATGSITSDQIAANSITAEKLLVGDTTNLCINNPDYPLYGHEANTVDSYNCFKFGNNTTAGYYAIALNKMHPSTSFQVGEDLRFSATVKAEQTTQFRLRLRAYLTDGSYINMEYQSGDTSLTGHTPDIGTSWETVTASLKILQVPDGSVKVDYYMLFIETLGSGKATGVCYVKNISVYRMANSVLISDGAITAQKLSIGSAPRPNLFYNPDFNRKYTVDGKSYESGWVEDNGTITPQTGWITFKPSSNSASSGFHQTVWLAPGSYSIVARMQFYNVSGITEEAKIGYKLGGKFAFNSISQNIGSSDILNATNKEINVKYVFNYLDAEGFVDVGLYIKGFDFSGYLSVTWVGLFADEKPVTAADFYCSNANFLKSGYKSSNLLTYQADLSGMATLVNPFTVNTSGEIGVVGGEIGCFRFDKKSFEIDSHVYDETQSSEYNGNLTIYKPSGGLAIAEMDGLTIEGIAKYTAPSIKIERGNYSSFLGVTGYECLGGSSYSRIWHNKIETSGAVKCSNCDCTSREKYKNQIVEKPTVLDKIKNSKIYEYNLSTEAEGAKRKTGFIVERETPKEIISDDGDGINLYSMASLNWKATQELLERLETLEEKVVTLSA